MIGFFAYFLYFQADTVVNNTYNKRSETLENKLTRGSIVSADGDTLAYTSIDEAGNETRIYPYGEVFAHVVGYENHGGLGIESSYNYYMLTSHTNIISKIFDELSNKKSQGDTVVTTLDTGLQQTLYSILNGNSGAIVAMDPTTGEIKGMVSEPGFDPNTIDAEWDSIVSDENSSVLLNRATQSTMAPGSTFKIFTLLEFYRENGGNLSSFEYDCLGSTAINGESISCYEHSVHGNQNIYQAFANSCNCAFATIGTSLDIDKFAANNETLLFNSELPLDIAYKESSFTLDSSDSDFMVAQTAFGQGETLISPIHLAMITSAIANYGVIMKPHLVSKITDSNGNTVKKFNSEEYAQVMTMDEVSFLRDCMRYVVTNGTAYSLNSSLYTAYGKTGTAETSSGYDHSWFTGFAESNGKTLVICVMIENSQQAGFTGYTAARQAFDYYFSR